MRIEEAVSIFVKRNNLKVRADFAQRTKFYTGLWGDEEKSRVELEQCPEFGAFLDGLQGEKRRYQKGPMGTPLAKRGGDFKGIEDVEEILLESGVDVLVDLVRGAGILPRNVYDFQYDLGASVKGKF